MSKEENLGADGFYHPFVPTPGPLRYRAISPDKESSYVGEVHDTGVSAPAEFRRPY